MANLSYGAQASAQPPTSAQPSPWPFHNPLSPARRISRIASIPRANSQPTVLGPVLSYGSAEQGASRRDRSRETRGNSRPPTQTPQTPRGVSSASRNVVGPQERIEWTEAIENLKHKAEMQYRIGRNHASAISGLGNNISRLENVVK